MASARRAWGPVQPSSIVSWNRVSHRRKWAGVNGARVDLRVGPERVPGVARLAHQGAAQDEPPVQQAPGEAPPAADAAGATDEAPQRFIATVKDRFLEEPWQIRGAVLFVPEVSLFGGGGGKDPTQAVAGGRDVGKIDDALAAVRAALNVA